MLTRDDDHSAGGPQKQTVETPERRWHRFASEQSHHVSRGLPPGTTVVTPSPIDHQRPDPDEEARELIEAARRLMEDARIEATRILTGARSQAAAIIANAQVERARILTSPAPGVPSADIDLRLTMAPAVSL